MSSLHLIGVSLSSIFIFYTTFSITQTFLVTSIAFAGLSLWGYTTKKDISGWGSFLIMGVIGLIVAIIVNYFLQSSGMTMIISMLGVLIFAGLTAYDTQNIKNMYVAHAHHGDADWLDKSGHPRRTKLILRLFEYVSIFADVHGQLRIKKRH
jgi:FtsH-binding integral membrane protein